MRVYTELDCATSGNEVSRVAPAVEVSVVIPIKDENDPYITSCLSSLKEITFSGRFEVVVVKGGNRAQARNFGIRISKGEIIAFIDSDCKAPSNWLSMLVNNLKRIPTLGGVGGINVSPADDSNIGKAIDFVFSSYLGSLGSASLYKPSKPKFVSALACINSAFWRKVLLEIGGFDEEFELCEDTNLSYKVRALGYKLLLVPSIYVEHYRRNTIKDFAKQFFSYGVGRMRSMLTSRKYANKGTIVPFIGVLLFPFVVWLLPMFALTLLAAYLIVILLKGLQAVIKMKDVRFLFLVPLLFVVEHFSYFAGMIYGIKKGKWKRAHALCEVFYHWVSK